MDRMPEPHYDSAGALPPASANTVFRLQIAGLAACAAAAIPTLLGAASPGPASTAVLALVAIGLLLSGYGLTLRPSDWRTWALASATALLASLAFPPHWDSAAMVARVLTAALAAGAFLCRLNPAVRYGLLSAGLLLHYGAIFIATTSPEPTPWPSNQLSQRVYTPYYRFLYLSNAYHFYSPEPGPASLLFCLVTYEIDALDPKTGKNRTESAWLDLPNRASQFKDPLGMTYQRRLSITELVSQASPSNFTPDNFEKNDAVTRRKQVAVNVEDANGRIPLLPEVDPLAAQYRVPSSQISRHLLPSYARHICSTYSAPGRRVASVKILRVEHRVIPPQAFLHPRDPESGLRRGDGNSPYNPTTYRPYYLGEFDPAGELVNPTDPMLYWLLPIVPRESPNKRGRYFDDYMSLYLKHEFPWAGETK